MASRMHGRYYHRSCAQPSTVVRAKPSVHHPTVSLYPDPPFPSHVQDEDVCRCALFHSAYSNSYVNLAVFQEGTERSKVVEVRVCMTRNVAHRNTDNEVTLVVFGKSRSHTGMAVLQEGKDSSRSAREVPHQAFHWLSPNQHTPKTQ